MPSWQGIPGTLAAAIPDKVPLLHETAEMLFQRVAAEKRLISLTPPPICADT
jgi:hypothetical protein